MTVTKARVLATGVLACGAVLLPVNAAFGNHMQMADGTMCPHAATGNMDNPATSAAPSRAASERPLGSTTPAATPRATPRPAVKPTVSQAPVQRAATTQPAQTRAAQPATTTAKATATAKASAPVARAQRVSAPVAQPKRVAAPVARTTPKRTSSARQATAPKVTATVIPDVTRPSAKSAPQLVAKTTGAKPADATWIALGGLLTLLACAATVAVLRRRGSGGEEAVTADELSPLAPSTQVDEVEIALREMLAEARAAELLGQGGRAAEASDDDRTLERL